MKDIATILPLLRKDPGRLVPDDDDCKHWIDSLGPVVAERTGDAEGGGSGDQVHMSAARARVQSDGMDWLVPSAPISQVVADLMDDGEELAGGRLEFTLGSGPLIATRQQIRQFLEEVKAAGITGRLVACWCGNSESQNYTLLKTNC